MRLVNIDDCNRALFYKQFGGKDSLITVESAFNMVEALPTAYDIEKVVEDVRCRCYELGLDESQAEIVVSEIVKQDGVDDDVCEWKDKELYGYYTSCTKFRSCIAHKDTYWKYCPYCGKKIKIVDR